MADRSVADCLEERIASIRAEAQAAVEAALRADGLRAEVEAANAGTSAALQDHLADTARRESDRMQMTVLGLSNEVSHIRQEERMKTLEHAKAVEANTVSQSRVDKLAEVLGASETRIAALAASVAEKQRAVEESAARNAQNQAALVSARTRHDEEQHMFAAITAKLKHVSAKVEEGSVAMTNLKESERGAIAKLSAAQEASAAVKFRLGNAQGGVQTQLTKLAESQLRQSESQRVAAAAAEAHVREENALNEAERTLDELLLALKMQEAQVAKHREQAVKAKVEMDRHRQHVIAASQEALLAQQTLARLEEHVAGTQEQVTHATLAEQDAANALKPLRDNIACLTEVYTASLAQCDALQRDAAAAEMSSKAAGKELEQAAAAADREKRLHVAGAAELKVLQEDMRILADEVACMKAKLPEYSSICHTTAAIEAETLLQLSTTQQAAADLFQNLTDAEERLFQCRLSEVQAQRGAPVTQPLSPAPRPAAGYTLAPAPAASPTHPGAALSPARLPAK